MSTTGSTDPYLAAAEKTGRFNGKKIIMIAGIAITLIGFIVINRVQAAHQRSSAVAMAGATTPPAALPPSTRQPDANTAKDSSSDGADAGQCDQLSASDLAAIGVDSNFCKQHPGQPVLNGHVGSHMPGSVGGDPSPAASSEPTAAPTEDPVAAELEAERVARVRARFEEEQEEAKERDAELHEAGQKSMVVAVNYVPPTPDPAAAGTSPSPTPEPSSTPAASWSSSSERKSSSTIGSDRSFHSISRNEVQTREQRWAIIATDYLDAKLYASVDAEQPGEVVAYFDIDQKDSTGTVTLIPAGSSVKGRYRQNGADVTKGYFEWYRLVFVDGRHWLSLVDSEGNGLPATDPNGTTGVSATVNRHTGAIFGETILGGAVAGTAALLGSGSSAIPSGSIVVTQPSALQQVASGVAESALTTTNQQVQRILAQPPSIFVKRDVRFKILVREDLILDPWCDDRHPVECRVKALSE